MSRRTPHDPRELVLLGAFLGATGAMLGLILVVLWEAAR